ncbi:MAG: acetyl-CoA carboxylase carboxyl transferase subunit alpha [Sulfurospirillum sp.]|nr:MAG: acetyl-CoA carboxylase carboxyl transferase subunit alpha [Sulfurospirillum sp.]
MEEKSRKLTESIFSALSAWQISQLSRHPRRPYTLDYIELLFTDFNQLHGDRSFRDDPAIVGGLARLDDRPVVVIGHQKGRGTKEKLYRNFGMPKPEGYRKALRVARLAEKFRLPLLFLVDTPGAYPGIGAEERGQSEAIAKNLYELSDLNTIIISVVIGEGGSGGALAIGVADKFAMMRYSVFSVISPEGCAAILWNDPKKQEQATKAMKITAEDLKELGLIDDVIDEPLIGAHRQKKDAIEALKCYFIDSVHELEKLSDDERLEKRYQKLISAGAFASANEEESKEEKEGSSTFSSLMDMITPSSSDKNSENEKKDEDS